MLGLIAAVYLLLALRVRVQADASLCGEQGSLSLSIGAAGLEARFDAAVVREGARLRVTPRYGGLLRGFGGMKKRIGLLRAAKPYGLAAVRAGRFEQIALGVRLGLDDAAETALAAGAVRALAAALCAGLGGGAPCLLRIVPDFAGAGLTAHARCIFSLQAGDIMFAVIKTAVSKTGREGFRWRSIPLKA